jgi:RNA polymerase sigma factor (sigma-70 family)
MGLGPSAAAQRQLRTILAAGTAAGLTDAQLLRRFADRRAERDEAARAAELAFAALVARHGPMVLGVCRRILADAHEAEDAFQATFLVLARRAGAVRVDDSLGRWLYGVSRRVALRARARLDRRRALEGPLTEAPGPADDPARRALRAALEAELGRLPEAFRAPLELCYLEGLTHREAARRLRTPVGTVRSRLARGRERLRGRLARLGLAPAAGLGAAPAATEAAVPAALSETTVRAAARLATGRAAAAGAVPDAVAALTESVLRTMLMTRLKFAAALLAAGIVATGAGVAAYQEGPRPGSSALPGVGPGAGAPGSSALPGLPDAPKGAAPGSADLIDTPKGAAPGGYPGAGGAPTESAPDGFAAEVASLAREAARHERSGDIAGALDTIRRLEERAREWDRTLRLRRPDGPGAGMAPAGTPGIAADVAYPAPKPGSPARGLAPRPRAGRSAYDLPNPGGPPAGDTDQERRLREVERKLDEVLKALKDQHGRDQPSDRAPVGR